MRLAAKHGVWSAPCALFCFTVSVFLFGLGHLVGSEGHWTFDVLAARHGWDRSAKARSCHTAGLVYLLAAASLAVVHRLSRPRSSAGDDERLTETNRGTWTRLGRGLFAALWGRLRDLGHLLALGWVLVKNAVRRLCGLQPLPVSRARRSGPVSSPVGPPSRPHVLSDGRRLSYDEMDALRPVSREATRSNSPVTVLFDPVSRLRAWLHRGQQSGEPVEAAGALGRPYRPLYAQPHSHLDEEEMTQPGRARRQVSRGRRRRAAPGTEDNSLAQPIHSPTSLSQGVGALPSPTTAATPVSGNAADDLFLFSS